MSDSIETHNARLAQVSSGISPQERNRRRLSAVLKVILWVIAVIAFVALAFLVHAHPKPLPNELTISRDIQAVAFPSWVDATFRFLTFINDPKPDAIEVPIVLVVFLLFRWFWQALFLTLSVGVGNGVDALVGDVVGRPRPVPSQIHVDQKLIFNSFPSGHSCHMMVFYGFLLYLTFTRPVRQSRYRWLAIPFQVWAIFNILVVGFARLWEGEHWLTDVIGGYLDGIIWLAVFIFLYNLTLQKVHERRAQRLAVQ